MPMISAFTQKVSMKHEDREGHQGFPEREAETYRKCGEKRHTKAGSVHHTGVQVCATYEKGTKGKYQLVVSEKSWDKLKQSLKAITRKTAPLSIAERIHKLKEVGRGWLQYFRMASIVGKLRDLDSWVRILLYPPKDFQFYLPKLSKSCY
jgi:hypothetical protein